VKSGHEIFFLRVAPAKTKQLLFYEADMFQREVALLTVLRQQTAIPLPEIIVTDTTQRWLEAEFMIMAAAPGMFYSEIDTLSHAQHDRVYTQLGQYMRQLHGLSGSDFGYVGLESTPKQPTTWQQTFKHIWQQLITDIVACGYYNQEEADSLITLLDSYETYFEHEVKPTLLHLSIRKENVIVDKQGQVNALLGFETALWGDPELDFATLDCFGIWASAF
jgi:aminoglycoside phosphotransferase (APT) family kinase protein